jgi:hypothetical protein
MSSAAASGCGVARLSHVATAFRSVECVVEYRPAETVDGSSRTDERFIRLSFVEDDPARSPNGHPHTMRRHSTLLAVALLVVLALAGCGSDDQPAVCDSLDSVRASADDVMDANVSENGMSQVSAGLTALKQNLQQLGSEAKTQFESQITAVRAAADQLSTSVSAAKADPTSATLDVVRDAMTSLGDAVNSLGDAMADTC